MPAIRVDRAPQPLLEDLPRLVTRLVSASVRSFDYIFVVFVSECVELWCDNAVEDDQ
jgi:hypothetical protein